MKINIQDFNLAEIYTHKLAVSPKEAASLISISESKIRKDIRIGILKTRKIGTRQLILLDELKRYIGMAQSSAGMPLLP